MTASTLATPRLTLRAVRAEDAGALHEIFVEPGVRLYLFDDRLLSLEECQQLVGSWLGKSAWSICLRTDGRLIGAVVLSPMTVATGRFQPGLADGVEFTIAIGERNWGWGAAFEAGQAALAYGFEKMRLDRIVAVADLPNMRSHILLKRLGFQPREESAGPKYRMRGYEAFFRSGT